MSHMHSCIHGLVADPLVVQKDLIAVVIVAVSSTVHVVHVVEVGPGGHSKSAIKRMKHSRSALDTIEAQSWRSIAQKTKNKTCNPRETRT